MFLTILLLNRGKLGGGLILLVLRNKDHGLTLAFLCSIHSCACGYPILLSGICGICRNSSLNKKMGYVKKYLLIVTINNILNKLLCSSALKILNNQCIRCQEIWLKCNINEKYGTSTQLTKNYQQRCQCHYHDKYRCGLDKKLCCIWHPVSNHWPHKYRVHTQKLPSARFLFLLGYLHITRDLDLYVCHSPLSMFELSEMSRATKKPPYASLFYFLAWSLASPPRGVCSLVLEKTRRRQ